ncbi:sugar ABC transporter ATP-binding protein [Cellulomonas fengjieae]|uniref:sugar ABC transporter ATP-binding protein n=1 Tax=Cellulomonas fengjieae TaxID=2819978 RepID=UPI001AAEB640|nr:sugar ABC transporter ATP-binding protein [Cellulomonas fengjieae]MBO3103710.1 sugar ABC transporter ATP-binding protein [Cellulomonas fengjieae]
MAEVPALELVGITKQYGPVRALDGVSLSVRAGEVHALMGENGAGKSTLLKVLSGVTKADSGTLRLFGSDVNLSRFTARAARDAGVAIVHQEFSLIPSLTVAENIFLGSELASRGVMRDAAMATEASRLLGRLDAGISSKTLVGDLSLAQAQLVEIAKALAGDVKVIALDEPSAVLSGDELDKLFDVVAGLAASGVAVLYVSHRMDEVFTLCERYTVLKDGQNSGTGSIAETDATALIASMVGRNVSQMFPPSALRPGEVVLQARAFEVAGLAPLDLDVRAGEVVGIAGLQGSGRTRLARGLFGDVPVIGGELLLGGKPARLGGPAQAMASGIAYLPEDRKGMGLALGKSVATNVSMLSWRRLRSAGGLIGRAKERALVAGAVRKLSIRTSESGSAPVGTLSGGNQQKVVIAKWLELLPDVVIFDEPTRGIDVGAKEQIYTILRDLADAGKAVILISSELIEVLGMSDRILVMVDGDVVGELPGDTATEEKIMDLIVSHRPETPAVSA